MTGHARRDAAGDEPAAEAAAGAAVAAGWPGAGRAAASAAAVVAPAGTNRGPCDRAPPDHAGNRVATGMSRGDSAVPAAPGRTLGNRRTTRPLEPAAVAAAVAVVAVAVAWLVAGLGAVAP
jgi:hypothetical protein